MPNTPTKPPAQPHAKPGRLQRPRMARGSASASNCAKPPKGSAKRGLDVLSTTDTAKVSWVPSRKGGKERKFRPYEVEDLVFHALQSKALSTGAAISNRDTRVEWDVSGKGKFKCVATRTISLSRPATDPGIGEPLKAHFGKEMYLAVRCRKCDPCLKARSAFWKLRAIAEIEQSHRTWFVTLTFGEAERTRADYAAGLRLDRRRMDVTPENLFRERQRYLGPTVTRWLKRVRKGHARENESEVSFRYLLVVEAHKDGFPHYHLLIHEKAALAITKRRLQRNWTAGFSSAKLVTGDDGEFHKAAAYTCKYIAKSALTRIRASSTYGVN